jgi:hypothetical protein
MTNLVIDGVEMPTCPDCNSELNVYVEQTQTELLHGHFEDGKFILDDSEILECEEVNWPWAECTKCTFSTWIQDYVDIKQR